MPTDLPSFPSYLLPAFSFPRPSFRNRQTSSPSLSYSISTAPPALSSSPTSLASSANTTPSSSPPDAVYFVRQETLNLGDKTLVANDEDIRPLYKLQRIQTDTLRCLTCATDLALASQIVSKGFTGRHGRAYLVSPPPNSPEEVDREEQRRGNLINIKVGKPVSRQLVTGAHVVADIHCRICGTVVGWKYIDAKEAGQRYKIGKFILETKKVIGVKGWEDVPLGHKRVDTTQGDTEEKEDDITFDSEDEDECDELFAGTWDREVVGRRRAKLGNLV